MNCRQRNAPPDKVALVDISPGFAGVAKSLTALFVQQYGQGKHQSPNLLMDSLHKGPVTQKVFPCHTHRNENVIILIKISSLATPVQSSTKTLSKWRHFRFGVTSPCITQARWRLWGLCSPGQWRRSGGVPSWVHSRTFRILHLPCPLPGWLPHKTPDLCRMSGRNEGHWGWEFYLKSTKSRQHIEAWTTWLTVCKHSEMHFLERKWLHFDTNFLNLFQ